MSTLELIFLHAINITGVTYETLSRGMQSLFDFATSDGEMCSYGSVFNDNNKPKRTRFESESHFTPAETVKRLKFCRSKSDEILSLHSPPIRCSLSNLDDASCKSSSGGSTFLTFSTSPGCDELSTEMKIVPESVNRKQTSLFGWRCSGSSGSPVRESHPVRSSTPTAISYPNTSHQRKVEDYFSTPKALMKDRVNKNNLQCRPSKGSRSSIRTPDEFFSVDQLEPMITDDNCQCCYRTVSDTVMSQRCCFCMKTGCGSCIKGCESCYELFCLHCSTSNYNCSYERILCLDCEDKS